MELVDQLRLTIPEEIRSAEDVLSQKDQILNTAANDARRTKSMAEDELRDRLNSNELVIQAEARAAESVRDAEDRITRMCSSPKLRPFPGRLKPTPMLSAA